MQIRVKSRDVTNFTYCFYVIIFRDFVLKCEDLYDLNTVLPKAALTLVCAIYLQYSYCSKSSAAAMITVLSLS